MIEAEKNRITVINYEDSTVDTILTERHVFMGNTYFYGKIVSMFGSGIAKGKDQMQNIMKYMMLFEMMKGNSGQPITGGASNSAMGSLLPLMMIGGSGANLFDNMFDFDTAFSDDADSNETDSDEENGEDE